MALAEKNPEALVLRKDDGAVRNLIINRPSSYNALSISCMEAIIAEFEALSEDRSISVVILSGAGKGFCAGHDLKEMRGNPEKDFYEKTFNTCTRMMLSIVDCPKPVIAKVHGVASAAGCQLVATCDLAVADESTRFSTPGSTSASSARRPWSRSRVTFRGSMRWRCSLRAILSRRSGRTRWGS